MGDYQVRRRPGSPTLHGGDIIEEQIRAFHDRICQCQSPEQIFGELEGEDSEALQAALRPIYLDLVRRYHPDQYQNEDSLIHYMASETTTTLNVLRDLARQKIEAGTYGQPEREAASEECSFEIETRERTYRVLEHIVEGDCANLYRADYLAQDGSLEHACLKVALSAEDNDLIKNEIKVQKLLKHKSLPVFLERFKTTNGEMAVVMRYIDGLDLLAVREQRPDGLGQEHVCWIFERLLSVLGFLHANHVIHGNIEPGNIMIRPRDHNAFLIDFVFSIISPRLTSEGFKGCTDGYSPPEVYQRKAPIPPSDMYSLGKSMIFLLGGDIETNELPAGVDGRIRQFLLSFVLDNPMHRARDAWEMWDKLRDLRSVVFENRRFVELTL